MARFPSRLGGFCAAVAGDRLKIRERERARKEKVRAAVKPHTCGTTKIQVIQFQIRTRQNTLRNFLFLDCEAHYVIYYSWLLPCMAGPTPSLRNANAKAKSAPHVKRVRYEQSNTLACCPIPFSCPHFVPVLFLSLFAFNFFLLYNILSYQHHHPTNSHGSSIYGASNLSATLCLVGPQPSPFPHPAQLELERELGERSARSQCLPTLALW